MKRNLTLCVADILRNMRDTEDFISGLTFADFAADTKTFNAVVRSLEVIGEAVKNIPDDIRSQYPAIPWKEMAGLRDKLIHFYFGVDQEAVWLAVKERIPAIKPLFEQILLDWQK